MVTTRGRKQAKQRQTRSRATYRNKSTTKKTFNFKAHDEILTSLRRKKAKTSSELQHTQQADDTSMNDKIDRRPIRKATKAALQSIGKVINYERHITTDQNDDNMDDSTFMSLPVLQVPDVCAATDGGTSSINNNDPNDLMEESIVTKDYGMTNQVHRSGRRHSASVGSSTYRTLHTSDFIEDETTMNRSLIVNNRIRQTRTTPSTSRNQKNIRNTNVSAGRKTPTIVNVPTMNNDAVVLNDELTTDGINSNANKSVTTSTINELKDVVRHFGLSKYTLTNIPSRLEREFESDLHEKQKRKYTQMVNVSSRCIKQVLTSICPGPSRRQLERDISLRLSRSAEDTTVRHERNHKLLFENLMEQMYCIMMNAKNGSTEKRVVKAILSKTMKRSIVQSYCIKFGCGDITVGNTKLQSNIDYDDLLHGNGIGRSRKTRSTHVTDQMIKDAVSFVLHKDHVATISWGEKTFQLGPEESVTLPRLCRKVPPKHIWDEYKSSHNTRTEGLGRSSIYHLIHDLTVSSKDIVTSIDYVQALLVAEPVEVLQDIIDSLIPTIEANKLTQYLSATSSFLKYRYNYHATEHLDDSASHDLNYILGRKSDFYKTNESSICTKNGVSCSKCKFPFFVCNEVKKHVLMVGDHDSFRRNDAIKVIDECQRKFKLFMGHRARCTNQNKAISQIEEQMKRDCLDKRNRGVRAIMIGDFKMKFEPMSSRETTLDHYGKRGISWHGFCLIFYLSSNSLAGVDSEEDVDEAVRYTVYLNQLLSDSNKQDSLSVFSLLDAAMSQIHQELPFITELVLQTDNAKSYSNNFLLCAISLLNVLNKHNSLCIVEFVHTETQDGKTILDAFLARCMKFVKSYISVHDTNKIKKIGTALELGKALSYGGGMNNTMIQVITTNKEVTSEIERKFEDVIKGFSKYFSRVNHAYFKNASMIGLSNSDLQSKLRNDDTYLDIIDNITFEVGVQTFSNIDRIIRFHIDMTKTKSKQIEPEQSVLDEIKEIISSIGNETNQNVESTNTDQEVETIATITHQPTVPPPITDDIRDAIAGLLDLNITEGNLEDDYYCDQEHCTIVGQQKDSNIVAPKNRTNLTSDGNDDDSSSTSTYGDGDSSYEQQSDADNYNDDCLFDHDNDEMAQQSKRDLHKPDTNTYPTNSFITRVEIEMMLSIDPMNIIRFDSKQSRNRRKTTFKGTNIREDVRSNAIRFANDHIQNGVLSVLSSAIDNPILDDSVGYNIDNNVVSSFDKGWGRRANRIGTSTSSMYGETYIEPYKDKLKELFEVGVQNSSRKMNAAMMRNELKKLFPNVFSIPGETEIKKYISQLFSKSKSNIDDNEVDIEIDELVEDESEIAPRVNWLKCLKKLVEEKPSEKPQFIYDKFISQFDDNEKLQLPSKEHVKKKISSIKAVIKRRIQRSIVQ